MYYLWVIYLYRLSWVPFPRHLMRPGVFYAVTSLLQDFQPRREKNERAFHTDLSINDDKDMCDNLSDMEFQETDVPDVNTELEVLPYQFEPLCVHHNSNETGTLSESEPSSNEVESEDGQYIGNTE